MPLTMNGCFPDNRCYIFPNIIPVAAKRKTYLLLWKPMDYTGILDGSLL